MVGVSVPAEVELETVSSASVDGADEISGSWDDTLSLREALVAYDFLFFSNWDAARLRKNVSL